jgi:hypothetical protein
VKVGQRAPVDEYRIGESDAWCQISTDHAEGFGGRDGGSSLRLDRSEGLLDEADISPVRS